MNIQRQLSVLSLALAASLTSCATTMQDRPSQVSDLIGWVERVHVESELAKHQMRECVDQIRGLVDSNYAGDAVTAYTRFVQSLKHSEEQAVRLHAATIPMQEASNPVFLAWEKDLKKYTNPELRERSQARMEETRRRYLAVSATVDPMNTTLKKFNQMLRDQALFLANDFNPSSVSLIRDDVTQLTELARTLDGHIDTCLLAAQEYVNNYALPGSADVEPAPAPGVETAPKTGR